MSNKEAKGKGRGFAGLADLAPPPPPPPPRQPQSATQAPPAPTIQTVVRAATNSTVSKTNLPTVPPKTDGSNKAPWIIGALVIGGIWIYSETKQAPPRNSAESRQEVAAPQPAAVPTFVSPAPLGSKPPIGSSLVLNDSQIRYCLAQNIRLGAWQAVTQRTNDADVDRFNARVGDYNARCGNFRYRRGALERVTADVESERSQIEDMARRRWLATAPADASDDE
jgi:hypothetical protein